MTDTIETTGQGGFRGWPADGLAFLAELEQDNTREFWMAHMHRYRDGLLEPTRALAAALTAEFGAPRVFRPHVDRRFRPAAEPYRTDTGATVAGPGGTPYVVLLSTRGLAVQVGHPLFDAGQLHRYRESVDGAPGEELVAVLAALHGEGLAPADVAALRSRPRGCPRDHPRLPLMRLRGLHVDRGWPAGDWLATAEAADLVRTAWRAARPLADWLDTHVGRRTEGSRGSRPAAEPVAEQTVAGETAAGETAATEPLAAPEGAAAQQACADLAPMPPADGGQAASSDT
ncbi:MAG: hypothetical protein QOK35_2167 [Pseudonocardiales bacterium]|nr:hypothetical protein [Pseudonocardiales bacterium]